MKQQKKYDFNRSSKDFRTNNQVNQFKHSSLIELHFTTKVSFLQPRYWRGARSAVTYSPSVELG